MQYACTLAEDGRVLCATFEKYAHGDALVTDTLPEGDITDYRYVGGEFIYDPLPVEEEQITQMDRLEAQVVYTAMMTDTLLEG